MPPASPTENDLREHIAGATRRVDLWAAILAGADARTVAEIGVFRGSFSVEILSRCPQIERYYMVDPWRHLDDWNKPLNKSDDVLEDARREAMEKTAAWEAKRVVLRGTTSEVIDRIDDGSLDFAYLDGDHTLRGVTIDLLRVWPKVSDGGLIGGDDFRKTIWQHDERFEPSLVFPYAVYFAEAVDAVIYALPYRQFVLSKQGPFAFVDLTGRFDTVDIESFLSRQLRRMSRTAEPEQRRSLLGRLLGR
jgi:hypothetical protein